MREVKKVAIINNIAPLYIKPLWCKFNLSNSIKYTFITSKTGHIGIKTIDPKEFLFQNKNIKWEFVKNLYFQKVLFYQRGLIRKSISGDFDVFVFSGDMYNLSTWIAASICKFRKKIVFFWGYGFYGNEFYLKKQLRIIFYKLSEYHFLYGEMARLMMIDLGFDKNKVITVYNSLDFDVHYNILINKNEVELNLIKQKILKNRSHFPILIFIGRLTKEKKLSLLLEAVSEQKKKGNEFNVLFVGDGVEKEKLAILSYKENLDTCVFFLGSSYDDVYNSKLLMMSDCCVSPGNVGLTAIFSLALGIPVITHNNFSNQMPEAESVIHNKTGFLFEENNVQDLSNCIEYFTKKNQKKNMELDCINIIKTKYNPQNQYNIISNTFSNLIYTK